MCMCAYNVSCAAVVCGVVQFILRRGGSAGSCCSPGRSAGVQAGAPGSAHAQDMQTASLSASGSFTRSGACARRRSSSARSLYPHSDRHRDGRAHRGRAAPSFNAPPVVTASVPLDARAPATVGVCAGDASAFPLCMHAQTQPGAGSLAVACSAPRTPAAAVVRSVHVLLHGGANLRTSHAQRASAPRAAAGAHLGCHPTLMLG